MGLLVNGEWQDKWYDTAATGGRFVRQDSSFRHRIGDEPFEAEAGRYHLYVSLACPWAHRTLIVRKLKQLEDIISVSVVDAYMGENGWTISPGADPVNNAAFLHQIYTRAKPDYTGRVTVPVLWDTKTNTIVNNESSEIIRLFNSAFDHLIGNSLDLYPFAQRDEIDDINTFVYDTINNGVYKAGFATKQEVYEEAVSNLFQALDRVEDILSGQRYLVGDQPTEADWRLFTTLVRFDPVYVGHFKCNIKRIADYPNILNYVRDLYQIDGIAETVNMDHIKEHYYASHDTINPTGIVPVGPQLTYDQPHNRHRLKTAA